MICYVKSVGEVFKKKRFMKTLETAWYFALIYKQYVSDQWHTIIFELQATRKGTQEKECVSTTTQVCRNVFWMTDWSVWCGWCGCAVTVLCDRSSVGGLVPCSWVVSPAVLRFPDSPGSVLTAGRLTVTSPLCWVSLWACLLLLKSLCPVL